MNRYRHQGKCCLAFGCGVLMAVLLPKSFVVGVAAILVIILALAMMRC